MRGVGTEGAGIGSHNSHAQSLKVATLRYTLLELLVE